MEEEVFIPTVGMSSGLRSKGPIALDPADQKLFAKAHRRSVTVVATAEPERIVAVAVRFWAPHEDSPRNRFQITATLPPPARHHDLLWGLGRIPPEDQGFITSLGRFVQREAALQIAFTARQLTKAHAPPKLYSEDLW